MTRGIVLFGHGSRDPLWRQPMDEVARRVRQRQPGVALECAFLELQQPDLATAVAALVAEGAASVHVLPMFLGVGKHAREDLPVLIDQVRAAHPGLDVQVSRAVGEMPAVLDLLADLATASPP